MTTLRGGDNIPGASTLTAEERAVVRTGLDALDHLEHSIYRLMEVGDAVLMLKAKAESVVGATERTFPNLLRLHGFEQLTGKNRALLTRLLQIMDKREQVLAWHLRLPLKDKLAWLSPSSIVRHCPALVDAQTAAKRATNAQARPPNVGHDAVALRKQVQDLTGRLEEVAQERDAAREQLATRAGPVDLAEAAAALQARPQPDQPAAPELAPIQALGTLIRRMSERRMNEQGFGPHFAKALLAANPDFDALDVLELSKLLRDLNGYLKAAERETAKTAKAKAPTGGEASKSAPKSAPKTAPKTSPKIAGKANIFGTPLVIPLPEDKERGE